MMDLLVIAAGVCSPGLCPQPSAIADHRQADLDPIIVSEHRHQTRLGFTPVSPVRSTHGIYIGPWPHHYKSHDRKMVVVMYVHAFSERISHTPALMLFFSRHRTVRVWEKIGFGC